MHNMIASAGSTGMSELLSSIGSVFTQFITWVGSVANTIMTTPILLVGFSIFVIGGVVGVFGRLKNS